MYKTNYSKITNNTLIIQKAETKLKDNREKAACRESSKCENTKKKKNTVTKKEHTLAINKTNKLISSAK